MKNGNQRFGYEAYHLSSNASEFEDLRVLVRLYENGRYSRDPILTLTWFRRRYSDDPWLFLQYQLEAKDPKCIGQAAKVMARIFGQQRPDQVSVEEVAKKLSRIAAEVVYDPRLSDYVPRPELPQPELACWGDATHSTPLVDVLAADEKEARSRIAAELAQNSNRLQEWVSAGCPVKVLDPPFAPPPALMEILAR